MSEGLFILVLWVLLGHNCKGHVTSNWYHLLAAIIQVDHLHVMLCNGTLREDGKLIALESLD